MIKWVLCRRIAFVGSLAGLCTIGGGCVSFVQPPSIALPAAEDALTETDAGGVEQAGYDGPLSLNIEARSTPNATMFRAPEENNWQVEGSGIRNRPPTELSKMSLPDYRVEPPDILLIDALRMAPKDPYFIQTLDVLQIIADGALPDQPIAGFFQVEPDGRVQLGPSYGAVKVVELTISEAKDAVVNHLSNIIQTDVSLSLGQMSGQQQITGEHLVGPDGMVNLGAFGQVYVSGMTIPEARDAVETHLSKTLDTPKISLDVFGYNSKVFYIIAEGAGMGDSIARLPITGNETVLDAISQAGGLSRLSSKKIWIARPSPGGVGCDQILPVDWIAIPRGASTQSNYQLLPGDRVFIAGDRMVAFDSFVSKVTAPFERMLGFTLLGSQTVQVTQRFPQGLFF